MPLQLVDFLPLHKPGRLHRRRLLINPGSATGAFNSLHEEVIPSFVLMDVTGKKVLSRNRSRVWLQSWALIIKPPHRFPASVSCAEMGNELVTCAAGYTLCV